MLNGTAHTLHPFARRQPKSAGSLREISSELGAILPSRQARPRKASRASGCELGWETANAKSFLEGTLGLVPLWPTTGEAGQNAGRASKVVSNSMLGQNAFPSRRPEDQGELLK